MKKNIKIKIFLPIFVFSSLFFLSSLETTNAQVGGDSTVSVSVSPQFPAPYQKTTVSLVSYAMDLDRATIVWSINGKEFLKGRGEKKVSFLMGDVGETKNIRALIVSQGLSDVVKNFSITAGQVDLVWEATDSYVPPFYKGKALPASQGKLKIVAIPNMKKGSSVIKDDGLVYKWKRNDKSDASNSGTGKNSFSFTGGYIGGVETVDVTASSIDETVVAGTMINIPIGEPEVVIYENRPLEGIHYNEALPSNIYLRNEEIKLLAEPYFFSVPNRYKGILSFLWLVGGKEVPSGDDQSSITLRSPKDLTGASDVILNIKHPKNIMQENNANIIVQFGNNQLR